MKTADKTLEDHLYMYYWEGNLDNVPVDKVVKAMKAYGRQCAEQALKDAAQNAICENTSKTPYMPYYEVDKESILETSIETP